MSVSVPLRIAALLAGLAVPIAGVPIAAAEPGLDTRTAQAGNVGVVGFDISTWGMDDAIRQLGALKGNLQAQQAFLVLTMVRSAGRPGGQDPSGRGRLDYHVETSPDGHIFINQLDVSAMIEAANALRRAR